MRKIILALFVCLLAGSSFGQINQIGDTVWINNAKLIPGDTLHLGNGSAPDGSFVYIWANPQKIHFKYLKKGVSYLIYQGRKDYGKKIMKAYMPVFTAPNDKSLYIISFPQAIESNEIIF
jgi:hypothetical protein